MSEVCHRCGLDWTAHVIFHGPPSPGFVEGVFDVPSSGFFCPPVPCPGGPARNVDLERWVAQCPHCDYTFSTVMEHPWVPQHYITGDGVTFVPDE